MAYSDLDTSLGGVNGLVVTITVVNPQSHAETARVGVTVSLVTGVTQSVMSLNFTIGPGETKQIPLLCAAPIASVTDDPQPFSAN